jgi:hypothetical protein
MKIIFQICLKGILISILLLECSSPIGKSNILGNWASFDKDMGYTEWYIDSDSIEIFSHWAANLGSRSYFLKSDTIYFEDDSKFKINVTNDSTFSILSGNIPLTLYRLQDDIVVFKDVKMKDDSASKAFINSFYERAYRFYLINKIFSEEELNNSIDSNNEVKETLFINNTP